MARTWRDAAKSVVAEVERRRYDEGMSYGAFKRALYDAYPFGPRQYYPYKVWLQEQRIALARHPDCPFRRRERGGQMEIET